MVPTIKLEAEAVTDAVIVVFETDGVGVVHVPVNLPAPSVEFDVLKQKLIAVELPFGSIVPFKVALLLLTEVASEVVATGDPAAVKAKT